MDLESRLLRIEKVGNIIVELLKEMRGGQTIPLSRKQAARYIGCCPNTIDNYRKRGLLKQHAIGGITGYLTSDLDAIKKIGLKQ
jgi:hypothetical protein